MGDLPHLVVFADDWGRHPSSAQHLVRELLPRWKVDWVNTVGTRRPSVSIPDIKKVATRLSSWARPARRGSSGAPKLHPNLTVHAPIHWPGFGAGLERWSNARLLKRSVGKLIERSDAVVATAPIVADLAGLLPQANWIYYCVDDLAEWPGLDGPALQELERDFVFRTKRIIVVSEHLRERMRALGSESELLTHGFDPTHWSSVPHRDAQGEREKPIAVFWGAIDRRLDVGIVEALAETCDLRLVGPEQDPDPRVTSNARVQRPGSVPYAQLPRIASEADVLVMPYADLPVTRAMQPLKLKEYLATGLPVVATSLPANREWADALDLVDEPVAFARRVLERAAAALPTSQARARERLRDETWSAKAQQFERWIRRSGPTS